MDLFIKSSNKLCMWNIISQLPIFDEKIKKEQQLQWFELQIENIYNSNKNYPLTNENIKEFNKNSLTIMINILKKINNNVIEIIKDEPIENLSDVIDRFKKDRDLELADVIDLNEKSAKKVSWEDEKNNEILQRIHNIETTMDHIKKDIQMLKDNTYSEVCNTINSIIKTVDGEN